MMSVVHIEAIRNAVGGGRREEGVKVTMRSSLFLNFFKDLEIIFVRIRNA